MARDLETSFTLRENLAYLQRKVWRKSEHWEIEVWRESEHWEIEVWRESEHWEIEVWRESEHWNEATDNPHL